METQHNLISASIIQNNNIQSLDECMNIASTFNTPETFVNANKTLYNLCLEKDWLYDVFSQLKNWDVIVSDWTKPKCLYTGKNCKSDDDFKLKHPDAYYVSVCFDWLNEVVYKVPEENIKYIRKTFKPYKPEEPLTKKECKIAAANCSTIYEFYSKYNSEYVTSKINGWLYSFFKKYKKEGYWTKKHAEEASKECLNVKTFKLVYEDAYDVSLENGWLNEFFPDVNSKEYCMSVAKTFNSRTELYNNDRVVYNCCVRNGWLNELIPKKEKDKKDSFWTRDTCRIAIVQCKSKKEFELKFPYAYSIAVNNGWLDYLFNLPQPTERFWYDNKERWLIAAELSASLNDFKRYYPYAYENCQYTISEGNCADDVRLFMDVINLRRRQIFDIGWKVECVYFCNNFFIVDMKYYY